MSALDGLRDRALASLREAEHRLEELLEDPSYEEGSEAVDYMNDAAAHVGYAIAHVRWAAEALREATGGLRLVVDNTEKRP